MEAQIERDLGGQPIAHVLATNGWKPNDVVNASTEQVTHKMVARACKGRRLTPNVQRKLLRAISMLAARQITHADLFNY